MATAAHTPIPWEIVRVGGLPIGIGKRVNAKGKIVSCFRMIGNTIEKSDGNKDRDEIEANAELIARAVNCHAELLAACKAFHELFCNSDMRPEDECHEVFALIKKAIKKAEEPT